MILHIDGDISRYYVQTLCLIFFPGSTFGEHEEPGEGVPEASVNVYTDDAGVAVAYAEMKLNDRVCEAAATVEPEEEITIATHETIAAGRALFAAGKELLGHIPPWGILTGVRPSKIATGLLEGGKGIIKSKKILRDEYFLNPQKASLAVSVASAEMKLLRRAPKNSCSVYISIPFCPTRCAYCSFVSYTTPRLLSMIGDYIDALCEDIDETFAAIRHIGMNIATVYIGGGTPTTLNPEQLERLLTKINENVDPKTLSEFTLEAGRPDTITKEKLDIAVRLGVSRISVNPQTLSDDILRDIGRRHTVEDFFRAFELAKQSGVRDINVDLIAGLPGDDFKNFSETVDKICELDPTNITVHTFCVKKAADVLRNGTDVYSLSGAEAGKCVSYSQIKLKFSGYKPYYMYRQKNTVGNLENVGFAKEGHEGLYNIYMMEEKQPIFAVGAGAVTKLLRPNVSGIRPKTEEEKYPKIVRVFNPKYPYEYLREHEERKAGSPNAKPSVSEQIIRFYTESEEEKTSE